MRLPRAIFQPKFAFLFFYRRRFKVNVNKIESNIVMFSARVDEIGSSATLKLVAKVLENSFRESAKEETCHRRTFQLISWHVTFFTSNFPPQ